MCVCSYQLVSFHKTSSYILKTSPFHSLSPIPISPLKHLSTWLHGCRQPSNSSTSKTKFKKCVYNDHCTKIFREILFVTVQTQNRPYTHEKQNRYRHHDAFISWMQIKSKTKKYCLFYSIKKLESAICVEPINWERGQYDFTHRELQKWTELIVKK